jgi:ABC-type uncharacterized transport system substrate-binding protein
LAAELTRLNVDVIFALGSQATFAAKSTATTIPVVFTTHADPVEAGFVSSLGRPDGTFSGASALYVSLDPLFLEHRARIVDLAAKERLPALYELNPLLQPL